MWLNQFVKVVTFHCGAAINWWFWRGWEGEVGGKDEVGGKGVERGFFIR